MAIDQEKLKYITGIMKRSSVDLNTGNHGPHIPWTHEEAIEILVEEVYRLKKEKDELERKARDDRRRFLDRKGK